MKEILKENDPTRLCPGTKIRLRGGLPRKAYCCRWHQIGTRMQRNKPDLRIVARKGIGAWFLVLGTSWNQRNQKRTEFFGPKKPVTVQTCVTRYQDRKALQTPRRGILSKPTSQGCAGKGTGRIMEGREGSQSTMNREILHPKQSQINARNSPCSKNMGSSPHLPDVYPYCSAPATCTSHISLL